jgi:transaldolase
MPSLKDLKVKIFADGADLAAMVEMSRRPYIAGLTTNPTLMRRDSRSPPGVKTYL